MKITVLATLMVFPAYFLVLYRGVGFIQNKRLFASAPKENLDAIPDEKERFPGVHIIGWVIELIAILLFLSAAALSVWDGGRNGFGFLKFSARFLIVLYAMEIYDITAVLENLFALVTLRKLSEALMERIHGNCRFSVGFNLTLIVLGVMGLLPPTTSALLHNGSTLEISLRNMTDLLDKKNIPENKQAQEQRSGNLLLCSLQTWCVQRYRGIC